MDDGSSDDSWDFVSTLTNDDKRVSGIRFLRNYGKSQALHAGFLGCNGRVVCTMDADLQDSPEELPELYKLIVEEGYDMVSGWKKEDLTHTYLKIYPPKYLTGPHEGFPESICMTLTVGLKLTALK